MFKTRGEVKDRLNNVKKTAHLANIGFPYRTQVSLGSGLWVLVSLVQTYFGWNFSDVTLDDDDTNSMQLMMPI